MPGITLPDLQKMLVTPQPPELGPGPRSDVFPEAALEKKLDEIFDRGDIACVYQPLIRALILLWHDHLDSAHVIAQSIENADGSFIHGIMHRREPDYGNAKYWFHRVGAHPAFPEIANRVEGSAKSDPALIEKLVPKHQWDPFAFIDACERADRFGGAASDFLREVQKIESEILLHRFASQLKA